MINLSNQSTQSKYKMDLDTKVAILDEMDTTAVNIVNMLYEDEKAPIVTEEEIKLLTEYFEFRLRYEFDTYSVADLDFQIENWTNKLGIEVITDAPL